MVLLCLFDVGVGSVFQLVVKMLVFFQNLTVQSIVFAVQFDAREFFLFFFSSLKGAGHVHVQET